MSGFIEKLRDRAERIAIERATRGKPLDWRNARALWPDFLKGAL